MTGGGCSCAECGAVYVGHEWDDGLCASCVLPTATTSDEFKARFPRWEHLKFEYGRWTTTHENYDASWEGEEDGWVDNGLMCEGRTLDELAAEFEAKEAEMEE